MPLATSAVAATVSIACLAWALVTSDFRLAYVADTTTRGDPWPVRLAGLWGGMSGSLLLWGWMLVVAAVLGRRAVRRVRPDLAPVATATMAACAGGFLAVSATVADPFTTLAIPAIDGGGLVPILRRPAMLYHPPLLYAGLVAMVIPFAAAVAALVAGTADRSWLGVVRRSTGVAWVVLTLGVAAGAHWAYGELGWGGFWAWDPIENAALLPWLVATAVLHAVLVDEQRASRSAPRSSTAALATVPFVLVVLGAYLTRSGAVSSVHAFAEARSVGRAVLGLFVVVALGTTAVVVRARRREPTSAPPRWTARRVVLAANAALLLGAALVVATGTLYPLAFGDRSVDGTFYARFTAPLALAAAALVGVGPQLRRRGGVRPLLRRWVPAAAGAGLATAAVLVVVGVREVYAVVAFALCAGSGVLLGTDLSARLREPGRPGTRRSVGTSVAHLGVVVLLAGIAGSTLVTSTTVVVDEGGSATVAGTTVRHRGVVVDEGAGARQVGVVLEVARGDRVVGRLRPAQTVFTDLGEVRADPALRSTPVEDLQVVLRRLDADGTALLDVAVRPLVTWVWWGSLLIAAGGALVLGGTPTTVRADRHPVTTGAHGSG